MSKNDTIMTDEKPNREQARAPRLPSDALRRRQPRPIRTALLIVGASAFVGAAILGASLIHERTANTAPEPRAHAVAGLLAHSEIAQVADIAQESQQAAAAQTSREQAAALAAQQAADAAKRATHSSSVEAGAPGSRVPFIPSSDPNNANGGDYEDPGIYCQSHSASGNPPVCD